MSENYPITPELLDDLFSIQYIIAFNGSGIALISIDVGKINIPDLLISGLLQAILAMINELKPKSNLVPKEERINVHEISESEHGFIIYFCQGTVEDQKVILAVVCSRKCSFALKKRMKEALSTFIITFEEDIKQFYGSIYPFSEKGTEILDQLIVLSFLSPFQLNSNLLDKKEAIKPEYQQIIELIKKLYLNLELVEGEGFFLKELVDTGIRNVSLPYLNLLSIIIDMIIMQVLVPASEKEWITERKQPESELQNVEILNKEIFNNRTSEKQPSYEEISRDITSFSSENEQSNQKPLEENLAAQSASDNLLSKKENGTKTEISESSSAISVSKELEGHSPIDLTQLEPNRHLIEIPSPNDNENAVDESISWYKDFTEQLMSMTIPAVKTMSLIESSMIREIEYERVYKFSKNVFFPINDLTSITNIIKQHKTITQKENMFKGPLFVLQNMKNLSKVCLSAVKLEEQILVIIFQ